MKDKLAEETLFKYRLKSGGMTEKDMIEAMQAYHEAANKAVTEADFEEWASKQDFGYGANYYLMKAGAKMGVRALRNGEIKHNG